MSSVEQNSDSRRSERRVVAQVLRVSDPATQAYIGNLVNLSEHGFMLISKQPVEAQRTLSLSVDLPREIDGRDRLSLEARCVWCQPSSFSQDFGAGFEIHQISADDQRRLQSLYGGL